MKKVIVGVLSAALVLGASSAFAGTKAGDKEVGLNASLSTTSTDTNGSSSDSTSLNIMGTMGYFMSDALEVSVGSMGIVTASDGSDSKNLALFVEPNYHFNTSTAMVPYAGVHGGMFLSQSGETSNSVFEYGAQAGIKSFLSENVAFNTQLRYDRYSVEDSTTSQLALNVGLVFNF